MKHTSTNYGRAVHGGCREPASCSFEVEIENQNNKKDNKKTGSKKLFGSFYTWKRPQPVADFLKQHTVHSSRQFSLLAKLIVTASTLLERF